MSLDNGLRFISTTIGGVGAGGLACLLALHVADRNLAEDELLAIVHIESVATLRKHLNFCAMHDYASAVKRSVKQSVLWHITDIGKSIVLRVISLFGLPRGLPVPANPELIALPLLPAGIPGADVEKKFSSALSSSSDLINQSQSDSDLIEEEEDGVEFKKFLCREYGFTGERAQQLIADPRIWSDDIEAWMWQVHDMERRGTKFRKSREAYVLGCLLKPGGPDRAPYEAEQGSRFDLNQHWEQFQRAKQARNEAEHGA